MLLYSWFLFKLGLGQSEKYESVFDRVAFPVQARSMSYIPRSSVTLTFLETSTSYSRDMLSNIGGMSSCRGHQRPQYSVLFQMRIFLLPFGLSAMYHKGVGTGLTYGGIIINFSCFFYRVNRFFALCS